MKQKYSEAEWQHLLPKLQSFPERSLLVAHSRLVTSRSRKDVANDYGLSPAHITVITNAVEKAITEGAPSSSQPAAPELGSGSSTRSRYTQEQWDEAIAQWKLDCPTGVPEGRKQPFPANAFAIAHAVLVLGHKQQDVASAFEVQQPTVQKHTDAIAKVLEPFLPGRLIPLVLWVRPEGIEPLKKLSAQPPVASSPAAGRGRPSNY